MTTNKSRAEAQTVAAGYRVKFVYDEDATFEESNGKARPLTEAEYKDNQYRGCPVHPRSKVPAVDVNNGNAKCGECGRPYADIPYAEYLQYFGNPDRHVYVGCIVEKQCPCCDTWKTADSLWHIDLMDDDPGLHAVTVTSHGERPHHYTAEQALALPGYLADVARDLLGEADYPFPQSAPKGAK